MNDIKPAEYWIEVDPETKNPTGHVCWAYFPYDRPIDGNWIRVREIDDSDCSSL